MGTSRETVYEYNGSLASLTTGGFLDATLINTGSGPLLATVQDRDGILSQSDDGASSFSLFDGSIQDAAIDYIGSGTMSTIGLLGLTLDTRPVTAFSVNGQIYLIAPEGFPLLSGLSITFDIDPDATYTLANFVPCLTEGTLILTDCGHEPIETLEPGSKVIDCNGDAHTVLWHGKRHAIAVDTDAPVIIPKNFFGPGVPFQTTRVSQQHRLVVFLPEFGIGPRFVRAKLLLDEGLRLNAPYEPITYHHLLFARHIVMIANGMPTESLLASTGTRKAFGEMAWKAMAEALSSDPDHLDMRPCLPELRRGQLTRRANQRRKLLEKVKAGYKPSYPSQDQCHRRHLGRAH